MKATAWKGDRYLSKEECVDGYFEHMLKYEKERVVETGQRLSLRRPKL
jgi:hypothetical protein